VIFDDLVTGDSVFVDANILVYHFSPHPTFGAACRQLIQRKESQDILGFTSTHTLAEVAHQLMLVEALALPGWSLSKVKKRLRQQPGALQGLTRFCTAVETVLQARITVLTIPPALVGTATTISQQYGLLTNDALIVALLHANGLTRIASHDADLDRVPGLARYAPV
jgi:predicted nucleic acid-binding protein